MNKLQHIKETKTFLRKVVLYRRNLLRMNAGKNINAEMVKTMAEIDYFLGTIKSFDQMMNYIGRLGVQQRIKNEIIPKNKKAWFDELDRLVLQGNILQGKATKQMKLSYT
jgi:hypothetical protein